MAKLSWFDIKTKFKKIIRSFFYTKFGQELVCYLITSYIKLVYHTSKKFFIGDAVAMQRFKNKQSVIIASWHRTIMLAPFVAIASKKLINLIGLLLSLPNTVMAGSLVE